MTPKGHCFFCGCLTEHVVGKISMCEDCMDALYHKIFHAHNCLKTKYDCCTDAMNHIEGY